MAKLQTSGPISIGDIKNLFGGPASPSMANYYRGGSYIPSHRLVWVMTREPTSGWAYSASPATYWKQEGGWNYVYWNGEWRGNFDGGSSVTSITLAGVTWYRGALVTQSGTFPNIIYYYQTYRTFYRATEVPINTGIPTSGQISLSQFYGAEQAIQQWIG